MIALLLVQLIFSLNVIGKTIISRSSAAMYYAAEPLRSHTPLIIRSSNVCLTIGILFNRQAITDNDHNQRWKIQYTMQLRNKQLLNTVSLPYLTNTL